MMSHSSLRRPEFDPRCEFVTLREVKISGATTPAGAPFDKSSVDARRLKQMYDGRLIGYAEGHVPAKKPRNPLAIGPTDLFNPGKTGHTIEAPKAARRERVASKRSVPREKSRRAA